jgi:hypothetical protein
VQSVWKVIWRSLKKLKIQLPYYLAIPLLGKYLKECTHVFCSTIHNSQALETVQMPKMLYIYTMEFYSSIKKNEIIVCRLME